MMRFGFLGFCAALLVGTAARAQDEVCVPAALYDVILAHQEQFVLLDSAVPGLAFEPITVVTDRDGRVFLSTTLKGTLTLGYKTYSVEVPLSVSVSRSTSTPRGERGIFGLRFKAGAYADVLHLDAESVGGASALVEPLHIGVFGINAYVGTSSAGGVLSVDLTRNFGVYAGARAAYSDAALSIPVGVFFSFN